MPALTPEQEFFWRDHVVLFPDESHLPTKRIRTQQIAVQAWIDNFVSSGQHTVIRQHSGSGVGCTAKISRFGQAGINDVLQQWTDQPHASATRSQFSGVPFSMSQEARLPTICGRCRVCSP